MSAREDKNSTAQGTFAVGRPGFTRGLIMLCLGVGIAVWAGVIFVRMHAVEPIVAGPGVTTETTLGEFVPQLAGTPADTRVFLLEGEEPGGTLMILGGTHAQEIAGMLAAILTIENARVLRGRVVVVPQSNQSGFTYTDPLEGFPHRFEIETADGSVRWFRNGMRLTNPVHQWPDPELYVHYPSGERMVGPEARNLNRNYPGQLNGTYTERVGYGIMEVARAVDADIVLDLHEAYPEYPIINMLVAHERAYETAIMASLYLQMRGIPMRVMPSPPKLRGLTHREFGDHTDALAILAETANPLMGRFRGRTDERLLIDGQDENYVKGAQLGRLFVPFTEEGHPLVGRVARHLATIEEILTVYNEEHPDKEIIIEDLPGYEEVLEKGLGQFLASAPGS